MKTLLLISLALMSLQVKAQTWIQVPDPNFQNFLTIVYPSSAFMTSGGNFYINSEHPTIQSVQYLIVDSQNISSLEGIEAFGNLTYLSCAYNQLTSLPDLPISLTDLKCDYNLIPVLPDLPPNLKSLLCMHNQLTVLPALPNTVEILDCQENSLIELPDLLNTNLIELNCRINQLTELPEIPNTIIDIKCHINNLTQLPDLSNSNCQYLTCSHNQLTNLPILPNSLIELDCFGNHLTTLSDLPNGLKSLRCTWNELVELPQLPDSLIELECGSNFLTELPDLPNSLQILNCNNNQIRCFSPFSENLQDISILSNLFTCLPNHHPAMGSVLLSFPLCNENDWINNPYACISAHRINGVIFKDSMSCINMGVGIPNIPVVIKDESSELILIATSFVDGSYSCAVNTGSYSLMLDTTILGASLHVSCPSNNSFQTVVTSEDMLVHAGDFGLNCAGFDLGIQSVVPYGWIFPGQEHTLSILAGDLTAQYNMHCASGIMGEVTVSVTGPGTVTFGGTPSNVSGNVAVYSVADFGAINANQFALNILTDTTAVSGDEFCLTVSVATNASGESDITNNLYTYCYEVVNSYDPNIKQTYPEVVEPGFEEDFTYTIYFQNTGSAPAFNIRLADTLDINLDLKTFKVMNTSHEFTTVVNASTRLLTVRFPDIMLPDSTTDPEGSIGFIQYRAKPLPGLVNGTTIRNTAYIYFDYNAPIITNTTENLFFNDLGLGEWSTETIQLYPNPAEDKFVVRSESEIMQITLFDINGKQVTAAFPGSKTTSLDVSDLRPGLYLVTIQTIGGIETKRLIVR